MLRKYSTLFCLMGFCIFSNSQPQPGDVYREYIWLPTMVKESAKFLRVGGKLDYKSTEEHLPSRFHKDGHIPLPNNVDLEHALRAEVTMELVASHEDTKDLAIQINGRDWIGVPDLPNLPQPQSDYMFHAYPTVRIPLDHFKTGVGNTFKLRVDSTQKWNWPQNIFYGFTFRIYYDSVKKPHAEGNVGGIKKGNTLQEKQALYLIKKGKASILSVDYIGYYRDFNWEGDGKYRQWHAHPHKGQIRNHIGSANKAPFQVIWETAWLPDQNDPLRISARVQNSDSIFYMTPAVERLYLDRSYSVELYEPYNQPPNWVTRADTFSANFSIHRDLKSAKALQLAWRSWSPCYARGIFINDHEVFDREDPCYDYAEHLITLANPDILQPGENTITTGKTPLIDGKMVHGMEMQYPGVMVKVKYGHKSVGEVHILEGQYEGIEHFIINTPSAIYYYDKAGGGLSRMLDKEGNDWIAFKRNPWNEYPAAAASAFRGIPNFVFGSEDSGAGHPGHDQCISELIGENTIRTITKSGKWEWDWTFFKDHAKVVVRKTDTAHPYWFLYEGTPGGKFDPSRQFFGTNTGGPRSDQLDYYKGDKTFEQWQWAYFGHESASQILFIAQETADELSDTFSYLGNSEEGIRSKDGMIVFGFGRSDGAKPLMTGPNTFYLGFLKSDRSERKLHKNTKRRIRKFK